MANHPTQLIIFLLLNLRQVITLLVYRITGFAWNFSKAEIVPPKDVVQQRVTGRLVDLVTSHGTNL